MVVIFSNIWYVTYLIGWYDYKVSAILPFICNDDFYQWKMELGWLIECLVS